MDVLHALVTGGWIRSGDCHRESYLFIVFDVGGFDTLSKRRLVLGHDLAFDFLTHFRVLAQVTLHILASLPDAGCPVGEPCPALLDLSLIHISEPTRLGMI